VARQLAGKPGVRRLADDEQTVLIFALDHGRRLTAGRADSTAKCRTRRLTRRPR
jgi:hypothetical protein